MQFLQQVKKGNNKIWIWILTILISAYPFYKQLYSFLSSPNNQGSTRKVISDNDIINNFIIDNSLISIYCLILLALSVYFLHKRSYLSLVTSRKTFSWFRFFFGLISWCFIVMIYFSLGYFYTPESFQFTFKLVPFLKLLLICCTLVALRSVFIEVFFRGYLSQGIYLATNKKIYSVVLNSLIYTVIFSSTGLLHTLGYSLLIYHLGTALLVSLIALYDEGLEIPISMQLANSLVGLLYISTTWHGYQTASVFVDTSEPKTLFLVYIPVFLFFPFYFLILKKIFNWEKVNLFS